MAPTRMQFDMSFSGAGRGPAPRDDEAPMRLLLLADLGGDRGTALRARKPLRLDIDSFDAVLERIAPRLALDIDGQPLALGFATLDDFHPDRLLTRLPVFDALRRLRDEAGDSRQFQRVAAALGLQPVAAPMAPAAPVANAASDIERLLGRAPSTAAASEGALSAAPSTLPSALDRWLHTLVAPHTQPDTAPQQQALQAAIDSALTALMRRLLHSAPLQALEAAWRGVDRLVRGLELDQSLQLFVLDLSRAELLHDLTEHRADLGGSALHSLFSPGGGADAQRFGLFVLDQAFGPEAEDVQALAALGALAARAGAPLLAAATPAVVGVGADADVGDLGESRRWLPADDAALVHWQALRTAPMAPWLGLALPRVLMRLPYGAATDAISSFEFEEMPADRPHAAYLWGGAAPALALLVGQAFQQEGWGFDSGGALDLDDLPSHVYSEAGERHQQPVAELLLSEEAGQALLERGLMPLLSWRQRNAARLLRWQSVASPAQPLQALGV